MTKYLETKKNSLEDAVLRMKEKLVGGQKKLDKDKDGDIDGKDFAILRKQAKSKKEKSEAAKPDFLDLDKDGNKKEPMKVAAKQAKAKKEEVELDEAMSKDMAKKILSMQKGQSFSKIGSGDMVPMVYLSNDERDELKKQFGRLSRDVPGPNKGLTIPNLINLALRGDARGDYDTEGRGKHLMFKMKRMGTPRTVGDAAKLAGLRLEGNELDENFIKLDEMPFVVGKMNMPKMKGGMKLKSNTNFDFRLFDNEDSPGSDKANADMNKEIVKASKMKDKEAAMAHMNKIQRKHSRHGATDTEPREVISQVLNRVFGESVEIDEKFSITLPPVRGGKKILNVSMGRAIKMLKDFGATKSDMRNVLSGRGGRFQNANGEMFLVQRESVELDEAKYEVQYTVSSRVGDSRSRGKSRLSKIDIDARSKDDAEKKFFKQAEKSPMMRDAMRRDMLDVVYVGLKESLDEGYESEVLKVLKDADIEGYFKMGKLYVSRRDAKDAKKALEDSDEITKLPKMVMEVYDIGQDYAKHTLEVTPGQSKNDVDEMLGIAEKKRTSMREALAKMWGMNEGKNPFKKSEEKDLTKEGEHDKTLTGKKPTKVEVNPELKDK